MRLLFTLKSANILLLFLLMLAATTINAKVDPTDNNRNPGKEQVHDAPSEQNVNNKATYSNDEIAEEDEGALDEEEVSQSTNSFNYFFYLIYKIKFADIFDLPNRKSLTRSVLPSVNLNVLLEKLSKTEI